jgi:predicted lipoprotein with Yx(FWY)xxD motif
MTRSRSITLLAAAAAIPLTALALASCGGGSNDATASKAPPKTADAPPATVAVANSGLGKILVDPQGRTLYLIKKDAGIRSACFGACARAWPPLRASDKPTVGSGANAAMLGTTARSDGKQQVTYNGHPLYLYAGDERAGDIEGQGVTAFGGGWYALTPAGNQVFGRASSSGAGNGY